MLRLSSGLFGGNVSFGRKHTCIMQFKMKNVLTIINQVFPV